MQVQKYIFATHWLQIVQVTIEYSNSWCELKNKNLYCLSTLIQAIRLLLYKLIEEKNKAFQVLM